jgi:hypothetical protein
MLKVRIHDPSRFLAKQTHQPKALHHGQASYDVYRTV